MRISVLQWNVWFKEDINKVLDFLLTNKADIICLQELTRGYVDQTQENTWDYLAHELGYDYAYKDMPILADGEEWQQGNAIFSKFPIKERSWHWINKPGEVPDPTDQYRSYVEVQLQIDTEVLTVATTHTSYPGRSALSEKRKLEIEKLVSLIDQHPTNYVLCGDLNAEPESMFIKMLSHKLKSAGPDFNQKTWTTKPHSEAAFEALDLDWRLDYIFVSRNMEVKSSKILQTSVSDHLPVLAEIEV
jgi:endonuclease/exonuclease/phosphatase family metal-dependent hydrolase